MYKPRVTDLAAGVRTGRSVATGRFGFSLLLLACLGLSACGGGSSSGQGNTPADDDGQGGDDRPLDDDVVDTPLESHTVSGNLTANDALQADTDVDDPTTPEVDNNTFATAQILPNPAIVKGFVTATPTNSASGRFADSTDTFDVFSISAFSSQSILLEIADFDPGASDNADLDIGLFSTDGELLEASINIGSAFEAIVVPSDGDYFLAVNAYSGGSNYTLSLATEFATSAFQSQISLGDIRLDRLAVAELPGNATNRAFVSNMQEGEQMLATLAQESKRIALTLDTAKALDSLAVQRKRSTDSGAERVSLTALHTGDSKSSKTAPEMDSLAMLDMIKAMNSEEGDDIFAALQYPSTHQSLGSDPVPDRFLQWNLGAIGWTEAVDRLESVTLSKRPILAVIDSGMVIDHPDLAGVIVDQRDFVPAVIDGDGFVADASDDVRVNDDPRSCHHFHGTHVSTTAVAPQNDAGITGVVPGIGLIAIKVGHNSGDNCGLFGDIANAILYAAGLPNDSGSVPAITADVINMSVGGPTQDPDISAAISRAVAQGVIVVASAGNDGAPVVSYPAADDGVIAVAATDTLDAAAPYSSFYPRVDIAAPGGDQSVDVNGDGLADGIAAGIAVASGSGFRSSWGLMQGTSMASPTVAAGMALMKGIEPDLTQSDIEAMLAAGQLTVDIGATGFDNATGFGLMSLPKMIESALQFSDGGAPDPAPVTIVTSSPGSLDFGSSLDSVTLDLVQSGGTTVSVSSITGSDSLTLQDGSVPIRFSGPDTANGFGEYSFVLDRGALESGALSGQIAFNLSDNSSHIVPVSAINQVAQGVASSAAVFFIIERMNDDGTFEALDEQFFSSDGVSGGAISSPAIEEGTYRLIYGTDTDNDFFICDQGELCGTFPFSNFGFNATFELDADISGADFLLEDVANLALTAFDGTEHPGMGARRISKPAVLD